MLLIIFSVFVCS